jgi:hypothetical protein
VELGIAPTFHSASRNQGLRLSPTNFSYSQIGRFAAAGHATAKAIFLGGVTRRFPELRFAFLEGGVGWANQLFGDDLIEHWERRSAKALERMHPDKLDRATLMSLVEKYGYDDMAAALRARDGLRDPEQAYLTGGVEDGDIKADDFHDFTFANAVRLWGTQNPRSIEGTRVARQAAAVLAAAQTPTAAQ